MQLEKNGKAQTEKRRYEKKIKRMSGGVHHEEKKELTLKRGEQKERRETKKQRNWGWGGLQGKRKARPEDNEIGFT